MKCYLCNRNMSPFLRKNGYTIYHCSACGLAQTDLHGDYDAFVKENYGKGYFMGEPRYSAYVNYKEDKPYILMNMKKFIGKIRKFKKTGKLLDVGCAMGFFVELALKNGYDAYGLDPSHYAVNEAKKIIGNRVKEGTVESGQYQEKSFDIITLFDVFEHLGDPLHDLIKLRKWLKDDGILVIATGNRKSMAAIMLKRRWTFYIPPQHLYFFDHITMTTMLSRAGLQALKWSQIGKWLSLRYVLHLARTTGESKLASILYPVISRYKIDALPLYIPIRDNMVVIAGKTDRQSA